MGEAGQGRRQGGVSVCRCEEGASIGGGGSGGMAGEGGSGAALRRGGLTSPPLPPPPPLPPQFNLADFTRRAYGTNYVETLRVQIHANARIRRVYFSDRLYSEEELPPEFKLFLPIAKA